MSERERDYNRKEMKTKADEGYVFVHGMGFVHRSPVEERQNLLRKFSVALGLSLFLYAVLRNVSFNYMLYLFRNTNLVDILQDGAISAKEEFTHVLSMFTFVFNFFVPFFFFLKSMRISFKEVFPTKKFTKDTFFVSIGVALGASILFALLLQIFRVALYNLGIVPSEIETISVNPDNWVVILTRFAYSCLLVPIVEETVYHGVLMQPLKQFGNAFALFSSSILFALIHSGIDRAINAFLVSLVIGYFVIRTNNIKVGILMHTAINFYAWGSRLLTGFLGDNGKYYIYALQGILLFLAVIALLQMTKMWTISDRVFRHNDLLPLKERFAIFFSSPPMLAIIIVFVFNVISRIEFI